MIDPAETVSAVAPPPRAILKMIASDRMAGSVPAWVKPESAQDLTLSRIQSATQSRSFDEVLSDALSYHPAGHEKPPLDQQPFGFGDLVDIVNPLQHIPLIGTLYRNLTGDQIRPSSQILGGALFGGFAGAAGGLANVIIKEETGKDITGNVVAMVVPDKPDPGTPVQRLAAAEAGALQALPGTTLSFAALGPPAEPRPAPHRQVWAFNE